MASCLQASLKGRWGVVSAKSAKRMGQTAREQLPRFLVNFLQQCRIVQVRGDVE